MREAAIGPLDRLYACGHATQFLTHAVEFPELHSVARSLSRLEARLGDARQEELWVGLLRPIKRLYFDMCGAPLRDDYLRLRLEYLIELISKAIRGWSRAYPEVVPLVTQVASQLDLLRDAKLDRMLHETVGLVASSSKETTAVLVQWPRLIDAAESAVKSNSRLEHCRVVGLGDLGGITSYDRLLLFGLPQWYPDHVFSAPRAKQILVVKWDWLHGAWKHEQVFAEPVVIGGLPHLDGVDMVDTAVATADRVLDTLGPEVDWKAMAERVKREFRAVEGEDEVEARMYVLEDDWVVFLEEGQSSSVLLLEPDESAEDRIHRLDVAHLEPGMFVLLRTAGGGDYVVPVADRLMGDYAAVARTQQRQWKQMLREQVRSRGIAAVASDLRRLGASVSRPTNVAYWMSERSIKTQYYESFLAIMQLIGLETKAHEYWQTMERILDAHRRAGFQIREMLLRQVDKSDMGKLRRMGYLTFHLPDEDAGSLTAFRVKHIANETMLVAGSRIGGPIPQESA